uniref:Uncharacterized protein n=1 Tax=Romanomermis culicivorax TaxID=13658 RepID=A0A915KGZ3_ROMCU
MKDNSTLKENFPILFKGALAPVKMQAAGLLSSHFRHTHSRSSIKLFLSFLRIFNRVDITIFELYLRPADVVVDRTQSTYSLALEGTCIHYYCPT